MISSVISRLVILLFGTLYPAYASYKAVRTKNVKEYVKWMMYWIVFALFTCAETFTDIFLSFWFPFYYEIKIILVIYLLSPATKGSSILYRKFVHPVLTKREQEIDEYIAKAKEQGYHTVLNLGSKGVNYATTIIMQTAIKGGGGLVNQIRKSYSLGDLSTEKDQRKKRKESEDEVDEVYDEDPRLRRKRGYSPRRTTSSASQVDLYFPEVDVGVQRNSKPTEQNISLSHIRSSEDVSSGYSSVEPLYGAKIDGREPLIRTSSVGATTRLRARASLKTGLPNKSIMTEDESGWTTTEDESQIETENPLIQSLPIPISGKSFIAPFVRPEYRYLFGNLTHEQLFTLINNANCSVSLNNADVSSSRVSPSKLLRNLISEAEDKKDEAEVKEINKAEDKSDKISAEDFKSLEMKTEAERKVNSVSDVNKAEDAKTEVPTVETTFKTEAVSDSDVVLVTKEAVNKADEKSKPFINLPAVAPVIIGNIGSVIKDEVTNKAEEKEQPVIIHPPVSHIDNIASVSKSKETDKAQPVIAFQPLALIGNISSVAKAEETKQADEKPQTVINLHEKDVIDEANCKFLTGIKPIIRSGKYNKKPAPIPPNSRRESLIFEDAVEEMEFDFTTPDSSPNAVRKTEADVEIEEPEVEKPKKKNRFSLPKIQFPFWHQKPTKNPSPKDNLSRNESFISLNDSESSKTNESEVMLPVREMSQSPSSKRRTLSP